MSFADDLPSFYDFKQTVEKYLRSNSVSLLTNESFKRKLFNQDEMLYEFEDHTDQQKPAFNRDELKSILGSMFNKLPIDFRDSTGKKVVSSEDTHAEDSDDEIQKLYKEVLGFDVLEDPRIEHATDYFNDILGPGAESWKLSKDK